MAEEFVADDGDRLSLELTAEELMDLPLVRNRLAVRRNGKTYFRSRPQLGGIVGSVEDCAYVSKSLPQWLPGVECVTQPGRHYGCPIIRSRAHEREVCKIAEAATGHKWTKDF